VLLLFIFVLLVLFWYKFMLACQKFCIDEDVGKAKILVSQPTV